MTLATQAERAHRSAPRQCFSGGYVGHGVVLPMEDGRSGFAVGLLAFGLSLLRSLRKAASLTRGRI